VKRHKEIELDFEIDKLTNSIENSLTGEVFETEVTRISRENSKQIKKTEWDLIGIKSSKMMKIKFTN
jgi:hypothetical protein